MRPAEEVRLECLSPDDGPLLFEWLNALIYQMATRKMLLSRFEVAIADGHLRGAAWGVANGATLTALRVAPADDVQ